MLEKGLIRRDLLPSLKGASSFAEVAYADIGIAPRYLRSGFPLQRLEFGPVQPYGLVRVQVRPLCNFIIAHTIEDVRLSSHP